jgi:hypothetical protein
MAVIAVLLVAGSIMYFHSLKPAADETGRENAQSLSDAGIKAAAISHFPSGAEKSAAGTEGKGAGQPSLQSDPRQDNFSWETDTSTMSKAGSRYQWPVGLLPEDIPPLYERNPQPFLEKLDEIKEEPESPARSSDNNIVMFSSAQPHLQAGYPYSNEIFDPSVTRLYAWFPCDNEAFTGRDRILVKWTGESVGEVFFEVFTIQPDTEYNYVWNEDGYWVPDSYSVEIYGLEEEAPLLAWGSYKVEELSDFVGFPALYNEADSAGQSRQVFHVDEPLFLRFNFAASEEKQVQVVTRRFSDGKIVYYGIVDLPTMSDGRFQGSLEGEMFPLDPGVYFLELIGFNEPQIAMGMNIFTVR